MKRIVATVGLVALAAALSVTAVRADGGKKNQGVVSPRFAQYGVTRIALGGFGSVEHDPRNDKLFQEGLERGFATTKYRYQPLSTFQDAMRLGGVQEQAAAMQKAALAGAPADSATVAAVRAKVGVDAVLFVNVTRMERNLIDADTRGQASTDVGALFVLVSLKDGAILWQGNFAERGLGPYNDPNVADVGQRDPTGNAQPRPTAIDPPAFPDVVDKLMRTVTASLPPPAPPAPPAPAASAPATPASPAPAH